MNLLNYIRDIPDFPKKGIVFKDITPLLNDDKAYNFLIESFYKRYCNSNINVVIGIEARGFIIGASLATKLGCGFIPVRKSGKLPYSVYKQTYALEYGEDAIEIHKDAIKNNQNIVMVDDVLATGGTIKAAINLVKNFDCNLLECCFMIELSFLKGRKIFDENNLKYFSLIKL